MSKIYEALLRAELERAGNLNGNSSNGAQGSAAAVANEADPHGPDLEPQPKFQPTPSYAPPEATGSSRRETATEFWTEPQPIAWPSEVHPALSPAAVLAPEIQDLPVEAAPSTKEVLEAQVLEAQVLEAQVLEAQVRPWHPVLERLPALQERGRAVEQFRSLRSRLAEFRDSSVPLKALLITSGLPQEGKSFIAANLAVSLARHRANRVLLVDGDIRRSSLHAIFGTSAEPGLTEYLSGKASLADVLQRPLLPENSEVVGLNGLASLSFIPGGSEPEKAADLAGNPRFAEMLSTLGPMFDWIIVDSSPVNLVSDGVNFARACDGVLMVAREGVTKFETAQMAQQQLKSARLLGFVLNAVHSPSSKTDEYNYGSYGSYGGYGYSTEKR